MNCIQWRGLPASLLLPALSIVGPHAAEFGHYRLLSSARQAALGERRPSANAAPADTRTRMPRRDQCAVKAQAILGTVASVCAVGAGRAGGPWRGPPRRAPAAPG